MVRLTSPLRGLYQGAVSAVQVVNTRLQLIGEAGIAYIFNLISYYFSAGFKCLILRIENYSDFSQIVFRVKNCTPSKVYSVNIVVSREGKCFHSSSFAKSSEAIFFTHSVKLLIFKR